MRLDSRCRATPTTSPTLMRRTRLRYVDILETGVHDDIFGRQLAFIINSQVSMEADCCRYVEMFVPQYSFAHFVQFLCCS